MKRKIFITTFILLAIIAMVFSGNVIATENKVITTIETIDLSPISVIEGTTPKENLDYENDQFTTEVKWYNSEVDPTNPGLYIKGTTEIEKFEEDDYDTVYVCELTLTPKVGYEFGTSSPNFGYPYIHNSASGSRGMLVGTQYVFDIPCTSLEKYEITFRSESSENVKFTVGDKVLTPGETISGYAYEKVPSSYQAAEGYVITKAEYKEEGNNSSYRLINGFGFPIESKIEVLITTETVIESVEISGVEGPELDKTGNDLKLKVPNNAKYEIVDYYWYNETDQCIKEKDEKFELEKLYFLEVVVRSNIRFSGYNKTTNEPFYTEEKCRATIDGSTADIKSVTKEDTNYYMVMRTSVGYRIASDMGPDMEYNEYEFIDNTANQTYIRGKDKTLTFKIDADYSLFRALVIDLDFESNEEQLPLSAEYYTLKEGSTIITLTEEYMDTLALGEHSIYVAFENGPAMTTFKIVEKSDDVSTEGDKKDENQTNPDNNENTGDTVVEEDKDTGNTVVEEDKDTGNTVVEENKVNNNTNSQVSNETNPQTGDNIGVYFIISIISIAGIVTLVIKRNKK